MCGDFSSPSTEKDRSSSINSHTVSLSEHGCSFCFCSWSGLCGFEREYYVIQDYVKLPYVSKGVCKAPDPNL